MRSSCRGVVSHSVTSTAPRVSSRSTGVDVSTIPPSDRRYAIKASVTACDPPRGIGQPTACAVAAMTMPKDALKGCDGLRNECAASPAISERACTPWKASRPSIDCRQCSTGAHARQQQRMARQCNIGCRMSSASAHQLRGSGSSSRRQAGPSSPNSRHCSSISRTSSTAVPSSSGCAMRNWRVDPLQPMVGQWQGTKEWGACRHGKNRGAKIMMKAGQRKLQRSRRAAGDRLGLIDNDGSTGLCQRNGRGQPVWACSHHCGGSRRCLHSKPHSAASLPFPQDTSGEENYCLRCGQEHGI